MNRNDLVQVWEKDIVAMARRTEILAGIITAIGLINLGIILFFTFCVLKGVVH